MLKCNHGIYHLCDLFFLCNHLQWCLHVKDCSFANRSKWLGGLVPMPDHLAHWIADSGLFPIISKSYLTNCWHKLRCSVSKKSIGPVMTWKTYFLVSDLQERCMTSPPSVYTTVSRRLMVCSYNMNVSSRLSLLALGITFC